MSAARARRHHYIPQFLLKGFAGSDGLVEMYDKQDRTWRRVSPKDIGLRRDLYTVEQKGRPSDIVERDLMGVLDADASKIVDAIRRGESLPEDAAPRIRSFIGSLAGRHARVQDHLGEFMSAEAMDALGRLSDMAKSDDEWAEFVAYLEKQGEDTSLYKREDILNIDPEAWIVKPTTNHLVAAQLQSIAFASNMPELDDFFVLIVSIDEASPERFILSDIPLLLLQDPSGPRADTRMAQLSDADALMLAVGPRHAIMLERRDSNRGDFTGMGVMDIRETRFMAGTVTGINESRLDACDRFAYAADRSHLVVNGGNP